MSINRRLRFRVFMRDSYTCQYCGRKAPSTQLHVDHRVARSKGGSDDISNLVTSCVMCNLGKGDLSVPIALTLQDGPMDGQTYEATAHCPLIWVWRDVDGGRVVLEDEIVDSVKGNQDGRKVRRGPSWLSYVRDPSYAPFLERLRFRQSDGASSELLGAYTADDTYPFHHFKVMTWMLPWQILLDFDFNDPRGE